MVNVQKLFGLPAVKTGAYCDHAFGRHPVIVHELGELAVDR
jgi:hypothetical protein